MCFWYTGVAKYKPPWPRQSVRMVSPSGLLNSPNYASRFQKVTPVED